MEYTANEALQFGEALTKAGKLASHRNLENNNSWKVKADPDTMEVCVEGSIIEWVSVFTSLREDF